MFIPQGSDPIGSGPTGPGSGFSVMPGGKGTYVNCLLRSLSLRGVLSHQMIPCANNHSNGPIS